MKKYEERSSQQAALGRHKDGNSSMMLADLLRRSATLVLAALGFVPNLYAAEPSASAFSFRTVPVTPMELPAPLPLGGSGPNFQWTGLGQERILRNVHRAELYPVRPAAGQGNGRAVLVVPGGGYRFVSIENEGMPVARRLAEAGYTAYVLVYRVKLTPVVDAEFVAEFNQEIAQLLAPEAHKASSDLPSYDPAVEDVKTAMVWLKSHAAEQGVDARHIGYIGFSAGARSGRALVEQATPAQMPHTLALIYGGFSATRPVQPVPPLFLAQAADDPLFPPNGFDIVQNWRQAAQRVELHLYERGSHGFGLTPRGTTSDGWMDNYIAWLNRQ